jgi:hypothetical protein
MHRMQLSIVAAILTGAAVLQAVPAAAQTCQQLWVERNRYYKNHGFCFKTQRAIAYFGNGGCYINDEDAVPLTPVERSRINQIVQQERAMGCDEGSGGAGMTCDELWVARNSIYKAHGFCFKTPRAISYFGNGGCYINSEDAIPLTPGERSLISQYQAQERAQGCQ